MTKPRFNEREWINDIATSTLAGILVGAVGAMFVPEPPYALAILIGGTGGLANGIATAPIKWLLERRPAADEPALPTEAEETRESDLARSLRIDESSSGKIGSGDDEL